MAEIDSIKQRTFLVELPPRDDFPRSAKGLDNFVNLGKPVAVKACSKRKALERALNNNFLKDERITVTEAIRILESYGEPGEYTHEISTVFREGKRNVPWYDLRYEGMQAAATALIIAREKGDPGNPQKYMDIAERYVDSARSIGPNNYIN